jgi:arylsulfatase A-like enzyme
MPFLFEYQHFILLTGDDHGWDEVGYNGHPNVKNPNLDEIAADSLTERPNK